MHNNLWPSYYLCRSAGKKSYRGNRSNSGKESRNLALYSCSTRVYYCLFLCVVNDRPSGFKRRHFMAKYRNTFCFQHSISFRHWWGYSAYSDVAIGFIVEQKNSHSRQKRIYSEYGRYEITGFRLGDFAVAAAAADALVGKGRIMNTLVIAGGSFVLFMALEWVVWRSPANRFLKE